MPESTSIRKSGSSSRVLCEGPFIMERLNLLVLKMETQLGVVLIGSMLGLISVNVIMRYIFIAPIYWSDELSTYLFVWGTFVSAAIAIAHGDHVRVGIIFDKFPPKIQQIFLILQHILIIGVALFLFKATFGIYVTLGPTPAMQIPEKYIYLILPLTFALFFLHGMVQIVNLVSKLFKKSQGAL